MTPMTALIAYAAWTLLLMFLAVNWRGFEILRGMPANSWTRGQAKASPAWVTRMEHAHMNCLENLPIFAVIVLAAYGLEKVPLILALAPLVLLARLGQSITHVIGTSHLLVLIRATFFTVQVLLMFFMLWRLAA